METNTFYFLLFLEDHQAAGIAPGSSARALPGFVRRGGLAICTMAALPAWLASIRAMSLARRAGAARRGLEAPGKSEANGLSSSTKKLATGAVAYNARKECKNAKHNGF